jgi:hypothetical protein
MLFGSLGIYVAVCGKVNWNRNKHDWKDVL